MLPLDKTKMHVGNLVSTSPALSNTMQNKLKTLTRGVTPWQLTLQGMRQSSGAHGVGALTPGVIALVAFISAVLQTKDAAVTNCCRDRVFGSGGFRDDGAHSHAADPAGGGQDSCVENFGLRNRS